MQDTQVPATLMKQKQPTPKGMTSITNSTGETDPELGQTDTLDLEIA